MGDALWPGLAPDAIGRERPDIGDALRAGLAPGAVEAGVGWQPPHGRGLHSSYSQLNESTF